MFVRAKGKEPYRYLQIVENHREGKRTVQRVLCTLGRVDELTSNGATDILLRSLARFAQQVNLVEGYQTGQLEAGSIRQLGPNLVFGRLWQSMGIQAVLTDLLQTRRFRFPVERAVYLTVLHRLFESGLDRAAERWRRDVHIPGSAEIELHHLFHQWDKTITGHVFCSFLGLVMVDELKRRLMARGWQVEWDDIRRDLEALAEVEVRQGAETYWLWTELVGVAGKVLQAAGVAIPPPARPASVVVPKTDGQPRHVQKRPSRRVTVELRPNEP